jgi:hypothetical protein
MFHKKPILPGIFLLTAWMQIAVPVRAQAPRPTFNGARVESATKIVGSTCSNPVVGFSFDLPTGMPTQDTKAIRKVTSRGEIARTGIGPEAYYFLWGAGEEHTMAKLCGAANQRGQVFVIAMPQALLARLGPNPMERLVTAIGRQAGLEAREVGKMTIAGHSFEAAEFQGEMHSGPKSKKVFAATFAAKVNSYLLIWQFIAYGSGDLKAIVHSLDTLKIVPPAPMPPAVTRISGAKAAIAPDFQDRLSSFLNAWLTQRNQGKTLSYIAPIAYQAPPIIGFYCDGWYKKGMPPKQAEQFIASNLMGVPSDFPKTAGPREIFRAWDRLPPEWLDEAVNDPASDHFLVAELNRDTLPRIFSDQFAHSKYEKYLAGKLAKAGPVYWTVFPELATDGDIFVIFTVWEKTEGTWSITDIDVVCQ